MDSWVIENGIPELQEFIERGLGVVDLEDLDIVDLEMLQNACAKNDLTPVGMKKLCQVLGLECPETKSPVETAQLNDLAREINSLKFASTKEKEKASLTRELRQHKKIVHALRGFEKQASVDIVFLLDGTGSMEPYLTEIRNEDHSLVKETKALYAGMTIRVGMVVYRDFGDEPKRVEIFNLSSNIDVFHEFVAGQKSFGGGGDGPEDVAGGMAAIRDLNWQSAQRLLLHMGDAPPHGVQFYPGGANNDRYPNGDPSGKDPIQIAVSLKDMGIIYLFGEIFWKTRKMVQLFHEACGSTSFPDVFDASSAKDMISKLSSSVASTMTMSLSMSASAAEGERLEDLTIDVNLPYLWPEKEQGFVSRFRQIKSMGQLLEETEYIEDMLEPPNLTHFSVASHPFAKGSCQFAFYAKNEKNVVCIQKTTRRSSPKHKSLQAYEDSLSVIRAACFLAKEFSKALQETRTSKSVRVVESRLLQRQMGSFALEEERISGKWMKYNSNHGYVNQDKSGELMQCLSHWSFNETKRQCMLVDLQGVYDSGYGEYVLSDPAIHCESALRFGSTNMSTRGMRKFFESHKCNMFCSWLDLPLVEKEKAGFEGTK